MSVTYYHSPLPAEAGKVAITAGTHIVEFDFWRDEWVTDQVNQVRTTLSRIAQSDPLHYTDDEVVRDYSPIWWASQDPVPKAQPHSIYVAKGEEKEQKIALYKGTVSVLAETKAMYDRMNLWRFKAICEGNIIVGTIIPNALYNSQRAVTFQFKTLLRRIGADQLDQVEVEFAVTN